MAFLAVPATTTASTIEADRLAEATERSATTGKPLLVAFIGEGWSVASNRFKKAVLDSPVFTAFAEAELVYFPVEARRKPKLSSDETAVLQSWVIHFDIQTYPTIILLAPDGQEILRHGYRDMGGAEYVELLKAVIP